MQYACIHAMQSTEKSADSHGDDTATCHSATSLSPYRHTMQHHTIIPTNQTMPYHTVPYHATSYYHASKLYQTKLQPVIVPPACRHTTIPCNIILSCLQTIPNQTKLQPVTLIQLARPRATLHVVDFTVIIQQKLRKTSTIVFFFFLCLALSRCIVRVVIHEISINTTFHICSAIDLHTGF